MSIEGDNFIENEIDYDNCNRLTGAKILFYMVFQDKKYY